VLVSMGSLSKDSRIIFPISFLLALIPEYGDIYSKILLQYFARKMTQVTFNNLNQPAILRYVCALKDSS
jgi:hypothetical protein